MVKLIIRVFQISSDALHHFICVINSKIFSCSAERSRIAHTLLQVSVLMRVREAIRPEWLLPLRATNLIEAALPQCEFHSYARYLPGDMGFICLLTSFLQVSGLCLEGVWLV